MNKNSIVIEKSHPWGQAPDIKLTRFGIVARDYNKKFKNGCRDFSSVLGGVLKLLDEKGCDSALFSLYSVIPREAFNPYLAFKGLKNIKSIFLEEFTDGKEREAGNYVVYFREESRWKEYGFKQEFGTIAGASKSIIRNFHKKIPGRTIGNCCVLLCGETNGVKYSRADRKVHDTFGLRGAIPENVVVILNPIHDKMTRFEMKLKRQFLSENRRVVMSVWNKGKIFKDGKTRDGEVAPWNIFFDGSEINVQPIDNPFGVEIGVFDIVRDLVSCTTAVETQ